MNSGDGQTVIIKAHWPSYSLKIAPISNDSPAMNAITSQLDRIDLRILQALQSDGRLSNLKLAEMVSLSPTETRTYAVIEEIKSSARLPL
jgi:hypothetical protein